MAQRTTHTLSLLSGGSESEDVKISEEPDVEPDDNRSRGLWDMSDEEEW
jgi:hypothetical protein